MFLCRSFLLCHRECPRLPAALPADEHLFSSALDFLGEASGFEEVGRGGGFAPEFTNCP